MFGLSPTELLVVGVVAVLLFGSRLPSVARSFGKSVTEFRRGMQDLQSEFTDAMRETEEAVAKPAVGALPRSAAVAHDDSLDDAAYDADLPVDSPETAEEEPRHESADA